MVKGAINAQTDSTTLETLLMIKKMALVSDFGT